MTRITDTLDYPRFYRFQPDVSVYPPRFRRGGALQHYWVRSLGARPDQAYFDGTLGAPSHIFFSEEHLIANGYAVVVGVALKFSDYD